MNCHDRLGLSFAELTKLDNEKRADAVVDVASLPAAGVSGSKPANKVSTTQPCTTVRNHSRKREWLDYLRSTVRELPIDLWRAICMESTAPSNCSALTWGLSWQCWASQRCDP